MKRLTITFFAVFIIFSQKGYSQLDKDIAQFIDKYADSMMTVARQPGMIISLTKGDQIIYENAKGLADIDTKAPMDKTMRFRIGSLTKTFTCTVLLQLVDEKMLTLDESIEKFFPDIPNAKNITIMMLGNMTSGLYNYSEPKEFDDSMQVNPGKKWKPAELVDFSIKYGTYFEPGTGWHYSNTNTVMLGMIIEKLTGNTLAVEIKKRIIDKLGMIETEFTEVADISGYHPEGYGEDDGTWVYPLVNTTTKYDPSWAWAAGAIISSLKDLKIYLKALAEGTMISKEMQNERLKPGLDKAGLKYCFGMFELGDGYIGHNGSYPGFHNISVHSLKTGITAIIFYNTQSNRSPDDFLKTILPMIE